MQYGLTDNKEETLQDIKCDFCDEFAGGQLNAFADRYSDVLSTRALLNTGTFCVFPSIGQLVEGYLLISPLEHYSTLADMPDHLLAGIAALHGDVCSVASAEYGPCISYEHGAHPETGGGCGVYHAHLHVVPLGKHVDPVDALTAELPFERIDDLLDLRRAQGRSYLYYEDLSERRYLFRADNLPSQYLRRLLARTLGLSAWNWRECRKEGALVSTITRLSGQLRLPGG